jgi:hypothetical protein
MSFHYANSGFPDIFNRLNLTLNLDVGIEHHRMHNRNHWRECYTDIIFYKMPAAETGATPNASLL